MSLCLVAMKGTKNSPQIFTAKEESGWGINEQEEVKTADGKKKVESLCGASDHFCDKKAQPHVIRACLEKGGNTEDHTHPWHPLRPDIRSGRV